MRISTQVDQGLCCNFVVKRNRDEESSSPMMVSSVDKASIVAVLSSAWYLLDWLPINDKKCIYDLHLMIHVFITIVQIFIRWWWFRSRFKLALCVFIRDDWFLSRFALDKNCCNNFLGLVDCCIVHTRPTLYVCQLEPSLWRAQKFDIVKIVVVSSKHRCCTAIFVNSIAFFYSFITCEQAEQSLQNQTFVEAAALKNWLAVNWWFGHCPEFVDEDAVSLDLFCELSFKGWKILNLIFFRLFFLFHRCRKNWG